VVDFDAAKPGGGEGPLKDNESNDAGQKPRPRFRFEPASSIDVSLPESGSYRFLLRIYALREEGPVCQDVGISVNGQAVTRLYLEKGWHWYEFKPAPSTLRVGVNKVLFDYRGKNIRLAKQGEQNGPRKSMVFGRLTVVRD
jgi:hypothetical protein